MKISIVQKAAIWNDLKASIKLAIAFIKKAVLENESELIVFGESWLTGYPAWLDVGQNVANWDNPTIKQIYTSMVKNSVDLKSDDLLPLLTCAKENNVWICLGLNENVSQGIGNGSLYNSLVFINPEGQIVHHHRKLMPTYTERLVHAQGDSRGLKTVEVQKGIRMGALICWEHWMPLSRQALHLAGETIHLALWPKVHEMHQIASRHYAFEGRCFVIAVGQILRLHELPKEIIVNPDLYSDVNQYILDGQSAIIGPDGKYLLHPQGPEHEIIHSSISNFDAVIKERMTLDVTGHYSRPDLFEFKVK